MFGIKRNQLTSSLKKISKSVCCYMGDNCDCKYLSEDSDVGSGETTGCPETKLAAAILDGMTDEEYEKFLKKAKFIIFS